MRLSYWCIISLISIPIKANTMNYSNLVGQPYPIILNPHGGGGSAKPAANAEYHVGEIGKDPVQYPRNDLAYKDEETGEERLITSPIHTNNSGAFVASKNSSTIIQPYMKDGVGYSVLIKGRRGTIYESKAVGDPGNLESAFVDYIPKYTDLVFDSISEAISEIKSKNYPVGSSLTVNDYYGGANPNDSGVLFFKIVDAGTGVEDGGKYINVDDTRQLEQILNLDYNPKAWGARLNGVDSDVFSVQKADDYVNSLGGGALNFPAGTLFIDSTINKSVKTHWIGDVAINYFLASDVEYLAGTKIRPGFNGVLISSVSTFGSIQAGYCGLENFSCAGRLEEAGFENVIVYEQSGDRVKGLKFKNLIFKRGNKGLSLQNASFCSFEELDFRFKENIDAPQLSDSEFVRCELGSGLPADSTLRGKLSGGYGLRLIGDNSAGSPYNGNNKFHRCRFQVAASTYANLRAEWMLNLKFFDCIFDQNEAQGGVFLNCDGVEFYGAEGFNNAENSNPKWTLQFGQSGANGCKNVKFFGGGIYNKTSPNANPFNGNGVLFSDTPSAELHGLIFEDSLVNKISGLSLTNKIYGGNIPTSVNLSLQNGWVENSTISTPKARKESNVCYVSGAIKDGTRTNGTLLFTLPSGYRPSRTKYKSTFSGPAPQPEWVSISTNGEVKIAGGDWSIASLNGIDFEFDMVN